VRKIQTLEIISLGIDISKNKADICLKERFQVLQRFVTTNDGNGISMLLNRLDPYLKNDYKKENKGVRYLIKAAIESTGNLWINMYEALEQYGINISLANPLKTRAIAEARIKYDKSDASILADLAGADLISKCHAP
jgi:transposase